jgi:hypothetical protein
VAELVDATDLKSVEVYPRAGSIPASGTNLRIFTKFRGYSPNMGKNKSHIAMELILSLGFE